MPPNAQALQARGSGPELGDPALMQQYNKRGRPIRQSAGKKKSLSGFVDSAIIEADDDDPIELPSEDEDGEIIKPIRTRKRKRSPSPTPPPFDPVIYNDEPDELSADEAGGLFRRNSPDTPVVLNFNIPLGYHGPLVVKLDRSILAAPEGPEGAGHNVYPPRVRGTKAPTPQPQGAVTKAGPLGFARLAPELRNKIYEAVFNADRDLKFHSPNNFCRSAQFLRTCRLVFSEGCSVLYGENKFVFERNRHQRAPFWDPVSKEIGYKDVRQFLKMIGPENLSYIRDVKITFEDSSPAATPYLPTHESRRYINDEHLLDCLRILRGAKLRKLTMNFHGRRMLLKTDIKFLGYLEQIKADEVTSSEVRWYNQNKINDDVFKELKEVMTRKKKMYSGKK